MKKSILWTLAIFITLGAAYYQRKTGPTYPKQTEVTLNDTVYKLKLIRSIALEDRSAVKLAITDTAVKAKIYFKRFKTNDEYQTADFRYQVHPVNSPIMNKVFHVTEEKGFFADIPQQPAAGKLQYYVELTDKNGSQTLFKEEPIVVRYKGGVPSFILTPHILFMFFAMLFSTLAGLMAIVRHPMYRKYGVWTLVLLTMGGMILGPVVQNYAFGEFWTGIPFGWDLTDNKTLIAFLFWILAVVMNRKSDRPVYTAAAALVLLLVYSIPHSMFGSELDYSSGEVTQGMILFLF